jgi:phage gp36-like protein
MAYITSTDVQHAAGGLANLKGIADADLDGTADADLIAAAITEAEAWVNAELSKRVATPMDPVPDLVVSISANEAVYILKRNAGLADADDRADHNERRELLGDIKTGASTTGDDDAPAKSALVVDQYTERSSDLNVSREKLDGFA